MFRPFPVMCKAALSTAFPVTRIAQRRKGSSYRERRRQEAAKMNRLLREQLFYTVYTEAEPALSPKRFQIHSLSHPCGKSRCVVSEVSLSHDLIHLHSAMFFLLNQTLWISILRMKLNLLIRELPRMSHTLLFPVKAWSSLPL